MWQEEPGVPWRVQLREIGTDGQMGFPHPEACFAFIYAQLLGDDEKGGEVYDINREA
jgi:hypothetical protein